MPRDTPLHKIEFIQFKLETDYGFDYEDQVHKENNIWFELDRLRALEEIQHIVDRVNQGDILSVSNTGYRPSVDLDSLAHQAWLDEKKEHERQHRSAAHQRAKKVLQAKPVTQSELDKFLEFVETLNNKAK